MSTKADMHARKEREREREREKGERKQETSSDSLVAPSLPVPAQEPPLVLLRRQNEAQVKKSN